MIYLASFIKQEVPHDLQSPRLASEYHKFKINLRVQRLCHYRVKRYFYEKIFKMLRYQFHVRVCVL